jgi:hypothetical protein
LESCSRFEAANLDDTGTLIGVAVDVDIFQLADTNAGVFAMFPKQIFVVKE